MRNDGKIEIGTSRDAIQNIWQLLQHWPRPVQTGCVINRGAAQPLSFCFSSTDSSPVSSLHSPLPQLANAFSDPRSQGKSKANLSSQLYLSVQLFNLVFPSQKLFFSVLSVLHNEKLKDMQPSLCWQMDSGISIASPVCTVGKGWGTCVGPNRESRMSTASCNLLSDQTCPHHWWC